MQRDGEPFIAHVRGPYLGHAVTVVHVASDHVIVLDPLGGVPRTLPRFEFERDWDGTAVMIVRPTD